MLESAATKLRRAAASLKRRVGNLGGTSRTVAVALILAVFLGVTALESGEWLGAAVTYVGIWIIWAVQAWPERVREVGLYVAAVGGVVPVLILRGKHADREFFVLAAEVIPLLFLAMAAGKTFSLVDRVEPDRRVVTVIVYFLILGEGLSLYVLATGDQPSGALGWAVGALVAAAVSIISTAVGREHGGGGSPDPGDRPG